MSTRNVSMYPYFMFTKEMCRAARVGLGWSRNQLAREAGIGERTLIDFERGARDPHGNNKLALRKALQRGGVRFTDDGCICLPLAGNPDSRASGAAGAEQED